MQHFWTPIIEPLTELLQPRIIVEVGAETGLNTRNLLEYARTHDAVVHVIDPEPSFDVSEWKRTWGAVLQYHDTPSLEALPLVDNADFVLIDGDHNWYTVINELRILDSITGDGFPVVLLHDVAWPYARRDLYYVPGRIPERDRHEHARAGMWPGVDELDPDGGVNSDLENALVTGGPHNGVLTAVEDFLAESKRDLEFTVIPVLFGLGIIWDRSLSRSSPEAAAAIEDLTASNLIADLLPVVEQVRLEEVIGRVAQAKQVVRLNNDVESLRQEHQNLNRELESARQELASATQEARKETARTREAEREAIQRTAEARDAEERYASLAARRSVRWALATARLTRPVFRGVRVVRRKTRRPPG